MFNATEIEIAKSYFITELSGGYIAFVLLVLAFGE